MIEAEDIERLLAKWEQIIVDARKFPLPKDIPWAEPEHCIEELADALALARDRIVWLEDAAYESMERGE